MIISRILGGLGNQMFQYAAGYALANQLGCPLQLDTTSFANDDLRNLDLQHFNTDIAFASPAEIKQLKAHNTFQRVSQRVLPPSWKQFYKQPSFRFDPNFFSLQSPVYIQGYFQSEKFFEPAKEHLGELFTFRTEFQRDIQQLAKELKTKESVAVHIRRGDYQNEESLKVHGILSYHYYKSAIEYLRQTLKSKPSFFVFTDDPKGVKQFADIPDVQIMSGNTTKNHFEDFYLMQCCRHNIIANSSFSWWAAWLNKHEQKIVIAPKAWFGETTIDTSDLLPESWLQF